MSKNTLGWIATIVMTAERRDPTRGASRAWFGRCEPIADHPPFSTHLLWLADLLDTAREPLPGCPQCVRVVYERQVQHGASERVVVSPGHEADAILHLPGGESGHPLSAHYRDQFRDWLEGRALPLAGKPVNGS